jgi:lauroyl/myristoyl acyltransferase
MFSGNLSVSKSKPSLSRFLQLMIPGALFRFLPFALSRCCLAVLGRLYYWFHPTEKYLIRETIQGAFQGRMAPGELRQKTREVFGGIFEHYQEKLFTGYANFPKLLDYLRKQVKLSEPEKLREALSEGRGVILVTGHFGGVELLPGTLALQGFRTAIICRFETSRLRQAQSLRAGWIGLQLIDPDHGNGFLAALKALQEGRVLIIECDEFEQWRPDARRESLFLNHRLRSDRTLELLHRRSGAPVLMGLVRRDGQRRYTCQFTGLSRGDHPVNLPLSEQCLRILDASVQAQPEQWYQWPKFAKMVQNRRGIQHDRPEGGYLAPEIGLSLPNQA